MFDKIPHRTEIGSGSCERSAYSSFTSSKLLFRPGRNGNDQTRARIYGMKKFYCFINAKNFAASHWRSSREPKLECATRRVTPAYNYTDVGHTAWDSFAPRFCWTETKRGEIETGRNREHERRDEISTGQLRVPGNLRVKMGHTRISLWRIA